MKTFFTRLGSLLLCGVAFAMVGCTDFSEDIQAVDKKVDQVTSNLSATDVKVENLQQTLNELSARLDADYATKAELNKVSEDLNKVIADQVAGLDAKIGKVGEDLAAAVKNVNAAIATLEAADAANEAAIEAARAEAAAAVATLAAALEAEKAAVAAEIEAINAQIAETNEAIAAVDAKAEENHNTLVALSDYLATLEAKVNELKATLDSLSEYLPTVEAKIASNTAKIDELKNTLESLALHLNAKEAEVDAKLNELHNTLASLSVYMDVLEASIDARFAEILNTIESLSIYLAKLEAQVALNTESSAAANAKAEELYNTILSLSEYLAEEKAANDAKFQEILNTFESLSIHLAKLEAEHAAGIADNSAKIAELKNELVSLSAHLEETEADYAAKFTEIQNTFLSLSEHLNAEEAANAAKFAEILATFESLSQYLDAEEAENDAKFAELQNTLLSLSEYLPTVEAKVDELKNTLESLANHLNEREPLVDAKLAELQSTLISLSIYLEEANLVNRVSALEGDLKAHKAAFEVFEAATVEQLTNLVARTEELFGQLEALSPEFAAVKAQVAELKNELVSLSAHLEERDAEVNAKFAEILATFESLSPVIDEMQAQIKENNATLVSLSPVIETMQAQILENFNTLLSLSGKIDELDAKDAEIEAKVAELKNELLSLSEYLPTLEAQIKEVKATVESLGADYEENKTVVDSKLAELHSTLVSMSEQLPEQINAVDAKANELKGQIDALAEQLPGIIASALAPVQADVEALLERVQSLVYVPDYSDHKATIEWAMIGANQIMPAAAEDGAEVNYTIVTKATDLKYLVKANAGEDAVAAAAAIAANPSVLDYVVTDVKTRGASATGADLAIANVKAEGEYIIVSVVAKNFDAKFFESKRQGIYSAALQLVDTKGNNLTSEYTNLVPGEAAHIAMGLYLTEADVVTNVAGTEYTQLMPCNDSETVYTSYTPAIGFVIDDEKAMANLTSIQPYLSVEDLKALGYDMNVSYRLNLANAMNLSIPGYSMSNNTINKYFITGNDAAGNVTVSVKENTPFTEKGKSIFAKYTATANGLTVTYVHNFELANAQVAINLQKDIEWTFALHQSLFNEVHYGNNLTFELELKDAEVVGGPLVNLAAALSQTKKSTKSYVMSEDGWVASSKIISNKSLSAPKDGATYYLQGGKYSWNNMYKVVFVTTNDSENVDYTTTIVVNLHGKPEAIEVPVDVDFVLNGGQSYFSAEVDLYGASFEAVKDHLGYESAEQDKNVWDVYFQTFIEGLAENVPTVNGDPGRASTLNNLAEARLSIDEHNNGRYTILTDEPNVIAYTANTWVGVPVKFTVKGNVVLPEVELIYSQDYVKGNYESDPYAEAEGEIGEDGQYRIIKSDLAKYFNVDAASLENHKYTVAFEVTSPEGDLVTLKEPSTKVVDKGASTFHYLESNHAVLDWATYTGLEVVVNATLKVNGFELQSRKLKIVTKDPLTLTAKDFEVVRPHRQDLSVQVFRTFVLNSIVEKGNILTINKDANLESAFAHAAATYGAEIEIVLGAKGVYYYDNSGNPVTVAANKYDYDPETGIIVIYGDDAVVKNYYADFNAKMTSRICAGEHTVPFRITFKK